MIEENNKNRTKEFLQEGWVEFWRFYCKSGYLDRWTGDSINNPNNISKSEMQLNSSKTYWRCNDGDWVCDREIGRKVNILEYVALGEVFTAQEIWDELLRLNI